MDEEELMWLAGPTPDDSEEWAAELEQGAGGWHRDAPEAAHDAGRADSSPSGIGIDAEVEERLGAVAAEEGWDESEVEAIRAYLSGVQPTDAVAEPANPTRSDEEASGTGAAESPSVRARQGFELPGGDELDEALAALGEPVAAAPAPDAPAGEPPPHGGASREWAKSHDELEALASAPRPDVPWPGMEHEQRSTAPASPAVEPPAVQPAGGGGPSPTAPALEPEPEWMRGRQDAAARAYRRLRRIFPNSER